MGMGNKSGGYHGVTQPHWNLPILPIRRIVEEALQLFSKKRRSLDDCFGLMKEYKPKQYQMGLMYRTE